MPTKRNAMPTINRPKKKSNPVAGNAYAEERRKIYQTKRWARLRAAKFANDPLCEACLQKEPSVIRPAEDVHHIVSFMSTEDPFKRNALAFDYDNLQSLCKECHQKIHNYHGKEKS